METTDRRKKKRRTMIVKAEVRPSPPDLPIMAEVINLSYGGIGILVKKPLAGRVQVVLYHNLGFSRGQQIPEPVWGRVAWKKKVGSRYSIGVGFEGLNPKDHKFLLAFLDRAAQ